MDRGGGHEGSAGSGFVGLAARAGGGGGPDNEIPRARPFHPSPWSEPRVPLPSGLSLRLHTAAAGTSRGGGGGGSRKERRGRELAIAGAKAAGARGPARRARTLTRLGVKFPHAGGAASGASLSHAPGPRTPRLAAPRRALLLREQSPSRAEPEAAPGRAPAADAAARLTPGRAEPPARRRGPRLPARPLAGRGASKARRAAEGAVWGRGRRPGGGARRSGGGARRGAAGPDTAPPSRLLLSCSGGGPGLGEPGLRTRFGGSGQ